MSKKDKAPTHGPEYEEFGKNLTNARKKLGLSQAEMAKQLNMNQSTYAGYETGTRKVPLSVIKMLSEFLNIRPDELINTINCNSETSFSVSDFEKELIKAYRNADYVDKESINRTLGLNSNDISKGDPATTTKYGMTKKII